MPVPVLTNEYICIVNRDKPELAAVISSYLSRKGCYLPLFEFPISTVANDINFDEDHMDEHYITRTRSAEFDVHVDNVIHKLKGIPNVILAGLSQEQKSYLTFLEHYNVIEFESLADIDFILGSMNPQLTETLRCRRAQVHEGLYLAVEQGAKLLLDETAPDIDAISGSKEGLVVIERLSAVSSIIAVNYALSIEANILIVTPLSKGERREIVNQIEDWKKGSTSSKADLLEKIAIRLMSVTISNYTFITFFTTGLPYSVGIDNLIPCSYIHLSYRPDFFIFNALFFESMPAVGAAVVFSPGKFKDEETQQVINKLQNSSYYVRELLGENASVYNIDMHVKAFPYDIFHICSHGGEVDGYRLSEQFTDRDGATHVVEFDEVVSFAKESGTKFVGVHRKTIWRSFDGLKWKSKELKAINYPHYVFIDMLKAVDSNFKKPGKHGRTHIQNVVNSCAIQCYYSNYQGMFHVAADGVSSPIVFNNTCWSWSGIAESFLHGGVRGYIGTLWNIDNAIATNFANAFYDYLFNDTILNVFHRAQAVTLGSKDENIYIYWGLHFSTIKRANNILQSRLQVCKYLLNSFYRWHDHSKKVRSSAIINATKKLASWFSEQIRLFFTNEYMQIRFLGRIRRRIDNR